jgi:eukaryotic translation initiation factor 2C
MSLLQLCLCNFIDSERCAFNVPEQRILVDLDAEKGRPPRPGKEDRCYCVIRPAKMIRMSVIEAYLSRQIQFDNAILEAISMLLVQFHFYIC